VQGAYGNADTSGPRYDALEISTAALNDETAKAIPSAVLSSTPDPALTAFAQLGLYRIDGSRALVSLFDRKNQHIVAEAVRSTPLSLDDDHKREQLWLCGTAVPRATSICEHVLAGPASSLTIPGNATGNLPSDLPVSVVLDLDEDSRFCDVQDAAKKFYMGVPIRSPAGINIGVYCVFDDKPRQFVPNDLIQFIRDMSRTIMDYLEAKRSHECYRREERMVRGLGSFVEGRATLSNWSQSSNPSSFQDIPGVQEGSLNKKLRGSEKRPGGRSAVSSSPAETPPGASDPVANASAPDRRVSRGREIPAKAKPSRQARLSSVDVLREDMESVFSKASNIIRESLEVEGVVYLDASVRSFGGLIGQELTSPEVLGKPSSDDSSGDDPPSPHAEGNLGDTGCKVLGFSTSEHSSVNHDIAGAPLTELPEKHLHWLLQRYPHGKIYNMEGDAVLESPISASGRSSSEADSELEQQDRSKVGYIGSVVDANGQVEPGKRRKEKQNPRQNVAYFLAKLFPGARSVAFVPLWDSHRNRWFAGSFVWTRTPTRIFTPENELAYLKVYGLTIMAEVTRLHIKAADKTKMDVLGSISHELRSPLHGVVGAVELLRQTPLDSSQEKTLRTIQISARTLLDTIDHLLDYGKMNGLIKSSRLERSHSSARLHSRSDPAAPIASSLGLPVQLDALAEEVVESVLAGYGFMGVSDSNQASWSSQPAPRNQIRKDLGRAKVLGVSRDPSPDRHIASSDAVQIYVDIEPADSWSFRMHPGAFRRIVMNLFGNSLKFTKSGFISIHLWQEKPTGPVREGGTGVAVNKVVLTVSDSGKGISEDYLRNHLYTPFAQEDHFAPGTGLGLSLVRQVVTSMGGKINVDSAVGYGTAVTITLPLPVEDEGDEEQAEFRANIKELAGLKVLYRDHDKAARPRASVRQPSCEEDRRTTRSQLQRTESMCRDWFHMQSMTEEEARITAPDFIISTDECFQDIDEDGKPDPAGSPHLFLCGSPSVAQAIAKEHAIPTFFELVSQPLGPRKLAKSLLDSRRMFLEAQPFLRQSAMSHLLQPQVPPIPPKPLLLSTPSQADDVTAVLKAAGLIATVTGPLPGLTESTRPPTPQLDGMDGVPTPPTSVISPPVSPDLALRPKETPQSILIVDDNPINRKVWPFFPSFLYCSH
jgi:signal transduction histidine kinase